MSPDLARHARQLGWDGWANAETLASLRSVTCPPGVCWIGHIVGAELLYSANIAVKTGDKGLLDLSAVLADRYGDWAGKVFLVGFWAAAMSSLNRVVTA